MSKQKKDGWFFSKSLLDEIYQIPIEKEIDLENEQELQEYVIETSDLPTVNDLEIPEIKKEEDRPASFLEGSTEPENAAPILYVKSSPLRPETSAKQDETKENLQNSESFTLEPHEGKLLYQAKNPGK
ncbi:MULTISPECIES: hypothetical protein [unclassified Enterococcus]|uniref:hypothetical protein n=1 Tax=unclassified Enterococcus TaxID=2608891 RepID=UPI001A926E98|nr:MULTISPECIES: hypothetical protein [unclassified Enterococcus]MBO0460254.1 hypothetical protein [Enterococcus sp. DIV1298c]MBO1300437.1 hypothetical protein [Enterococcus sp. DIV1271a]